MFSSELSSSDSIDEKDASLVAQVAALTEQVEELERRNGDLSRRVGSLEVRKADLERENLDIRSSVTFHSNLRDKGDRSDTSEGSSERSAGPVMRCQNR